MSNEYQFVHVSAWAICFKINFIPCWFLKIIGCIRTHQRSLLYTSMNQNQIYPSHRLSILNLFSIHEIIYTYKILLIIFCSINENICCHEVIKYWTKPLSNIFYYSCTSTTWLSQHFLSWMMESKEENIFPISTKVFLYSRNINIILINIENTKIFAFEKGRIFIERAERKFLALVWKAEKFCGTKKRQKNIFVFSKLHKLPAKTLLFICCQEKISF